jgi:hypothetical protein
MSRLMTSWQQGHSICRSVLKSQPLGHLCAIFPLFWSAFFPLGVRFILMISFNPNILFSFTLELLEAKETVPGILSFGFPLANCRKLQHDVPYNLFHVKATPT